MENIEGLRKQLSKGTYYNNDIDNPVKGAVKNVLIFDDNEIAIFYNGGSVKTYLDRMKPIRRPSNIIAKFEWCFILKDEKDNVVGYIGRIKGDAEMNKKKIEKRFDQVVGTIKNLKDINVEDNRVVTGYGMHVDETHTIAYYPKENVIRFWEDGKELLKVSEDSPIIVMFEELIGHTNGLY